MSALHLFRNFFASRLFSRAEALSGPFDIIKWWELRRPAYNLIVGATGGVTLVVSLVVAVIASAQFGEPLGWPDPPIFAIFAVIVYGIGANICYTGGWMTELAVKTIWQDRAQSWGPISFALGLVFSILLTLAPAMLFIVVLIFRWLLEK